MLNSFGDVMMDYTDYVGGWLTIIIVTVIVVAVAIFAAKKIVKIGKENKATGAKQNKTTKKK